NHHFPLINPLSLHDALPICIKPKDGEPTPLGSFVPLACTAPVVNVSATAGNQEESFVVVNPTNTNNLVVLSNTTTNSIFRAYSLDRKSTRLNSSHSQISYAV